MSKNCCEHELFGSIPISTVATFGGCKDSGYSRESGLVAIYDCIHPNTVWSNTSTNPIAKPFVIQ